MFVSGRVQGKSCAGTGLFPLQGFFTAVDRETLRYWRVTAANLAELAAGTDDSGSGSVLWGAARPSKGVRPTAEVQPHVQAHVATSAEPVVNTLWKVRLTFRDRISSHP